MEGAIKKRNEGRNSELGPIKFSELSILNFEFEMICKGLVPKSVKF